jgi:hypothetical protein
MLLFLSLPPLQKGDWKAGLGQEGVLKVQILVALAIKVAARWAPAQPCPTSYNLPLLVAKV